MKTPVAEVVSWCIFPNAEGRGLSVKFGDAQAVWRRGGRFEVGVLYHGVDDRVRATRLVATVRVKGQEDFDLDDVRHEAD